MIPHIEGAPSRLRDSASTAQLTQTQLEVLKFIRHFIANEEYSPSSRQITEHFGWNSQASAMNHLNALTAKGMIRKPVPRAIVVTQDGKDLIPLS